MRFPNIYVAVDGTVAVVPERYFETQSGATYNVTIADTSVATCEQNGNKLIFSGKQSGTTTATIKAGSTEQHFTITVRRGADSNGWL
jgi:hypothetical protein